MSISQRTEILDRLSKANANADIGNGIGANDLVPLAEFHSRRVGRLLLNQLFEKNIRYRAKYRRIKMSIEVPFKDRKTAYAMLENFTETHRDERPTGKRRDYDAVFLCGLLAIGPSIIMWMGPVPNWIAAAYFTSASLLGLFIDRLQRNYRYYGEFHIGALDCLWLTLLTAICLAIWRIAI